MTTSLAYDIVCTIAEREGVDPEELEYALEDHVPTEAIETLVAHESATWTLSFEVPQHRLTVTHQERIVVDALPGRGTQDSAGS